MNSAELVKRQRRPVTYTLPQSGYESKHVGEVNGIAIQSSEVVHTGGRDGTVRTWNLSTGMPKCARTYEGHGGWVNDIALVTPTLLASASSDHTVRLWNMSSSGEESTSGGCAAVLQGHGDYVMALARASGGGGAVTKFASGGLNREIFLWDVERCLAVSAAPSYLSTKNDACVTPLSGSKESIYALGMDGTGNILVSGGTELALRVWDTRSAQKEGKLKGHRDNVRAIVVDAEGRKCVTASSDRTIRLWDIGEQRCIQTFAGMHLGSIWALAANSDFSRVYSGGSDSRICVTSLKHRKSNLLAVESASILKFRLDETRRDRSSDGDLWTATASKSIRRWSANVTSVDVEESTKKGSIHKSTPTLPASLLRQPGVWFDVGSPSSAHSFGTPRKFDHWGDTAAPNATQNIQLAPTMEIFGASPIVRLEVLHNKTQVLTKDSVGVIALWDVTSGKPVRTFDGVADGSDFATLLESEVINPKVTVPTWFTVDARSGSLGVTLAPSTAFQAEAYATDLGVPEASAEERRNLGVEVIRLLMDDWAEKLGCLRSQPRAFAEPLPSGSSMLFAHPINGSGKVCVKAGDLVGKIEEREILPKWFVDHALNQAPEPESPKISFSLVPSRASGDEYATDVPSISPSSATAPKILGAKKIVEYVAKNIKVDGARVELVCEGEVISPSSAASTEVEPTLASVHARVWKKSPPIVIEYRVRAR